MDDARYAEWSASLVQLPDTHFFDLMRLYLGVLKTPFHKQRLVQQLSAFLQRKSIQNAVVQMLDELDLLFISVVMCVPRATLELLTIFFRT